ncbi:hypothetical protein IFM89_007986 [Coptis chinensis]|uniref:F-box domain-containing protein n=1 Tax=Coptis chinensis TaxID=261450 RepID=A0A835IKS4_9MAGN|nr:hypothetical protein IFM89_007986 [Coptis chinensis]
MEKKQKISGTLENLNRINRLPVPVIHHVLSFLPVQEVVQTCVLSRGWRNLWCSVPTLDFDEQLNGGDFSKFFNKVLILRDGSDIEKFRLNLHQKNLYHSNSKVNNWILYAIRHNVQILGLQNTHEKYIHLNSQIFTCESLTELYLYHASIHLPESVCLPALSVLHLRSVYFKDEYLDEGLFSACPSLENLTLENCDFECDMLSITASELKNLRMKGLFPSSIVISAPNLVSLELIINNELPLNLMFNGDLKALSHANVDVKLDSFDLTTELISIIKHARYLTFSACFLQSIISAELHKHVPILSCIIQTPFFNLKWLKIGTTFRNDETIVINNILRHSPEIESVFFVNDVDCRRMLLYAERLLKAIGYKMQYNLEVYKMLHS